MMGTTGNRPQPRPFWCVPAAPFLTTWPPSKGRHGITTIGPTRAVACRVTGQQMTGDPLAARHGADGQLLPTFKLFLAPITNRTETRSRHLAADPTYLQVTVPEDADKIGRQAEDELPASGVGDVYLAWQRQGMAPHRSRRYSAVREMGPLRLLAESRHVQQRQIRPGPVQGIQRMVRENAERGRSRRFACA